VRLQSRSFARRNQSLRMIGDSHFRILGLIIDDCIFHQCNCWSQIARKFAIHEIAIALLAGALIFACAIMH